MPFQEVTGILCLPNWIRIPMSICFYMRQNFRMKAMSDESLKINSLLLSRVTKNDPDFALYAFQRAISYREMGNHQVEKKYFILSATADIRAAVKDNVSLTLLAILLFDQKDIDLAYKYIMFSLEDAKFYNSRLRFVEISRILPLISQAFQVKSDKQKMQLRFYAIALTLLDCPSYFGLAVYVLPDEKAFQGQEGSAKCQCPTVRI